MIKVHIVMKNNDAYDLTFEDCETFGEVLDSFEQPGNLIGHNFYINGESISHMFAIDKEELDETQIDKIVKETRNEEYILNKLTEIIEIYKGLPLMVHEETDIRDDIDMDESSIVDIYESIEEEFKINIDDLELEKLFQMRTIGELVSFIKIKYKNKISNLC